MNVTTTPINDLHISALRPLVSPQELKEKLPINDRSARTVVESRRAIGDIMARRDPRLLAIVGPCSIHDEQAAAEYAGLLNEVRTRLEDRVFLVMRVYFEKPRTTIGWRGFIIDPHLDGSYDIASGLFKARKLLLEITGMGLPAATEMLDPIVPQYTADLISWAAIGARTSESQTHRDMASGLSMPVGFKNNTDGNIQTAVDAVIASTRPHSFLGIDQHGRTCVVSTTGNPDSHIILRGGRRSANFELETLREASQLLRDAGLQPLYIVDCSHGNSGKNHRRQVVVLKSILESRHQGLKDIQGFMLESNLREGAQKLASDPAELLYGVSITDECVGWDETAELLQMAYEQYL